MKAVVWTDSLQMMIIFAGMLALIIEGTRDAGGPTQVWERAIKGGRIQTDAYVYREDGFSHFCSYFLLFMINKKSRGIELISHNCGI